MAAPIGAIVGTTYDAALGTVVEPGHALVTGTGRTYVILTAKRVQKQFRSWRWRLRCQVTDETPPVGAVAHPLVWYRRDRGVPTT